MTVPVIPFAEAEALLDWIAFTERFQVYTAPMPKTGKMANSTFMLVPYIGPKKREANISS